CGSVACLHVWEVNLPHRSAHEFTIDRLSSRGRSSNATSSSWTSHTFRPSISRGPGTRPSLTIPSNLDGEMPRYIAGSILERPRRGMGRIWERERLLTVIGG